MIKKKICMLGGFAVGKTSLVQRFVKSIFSEKYLTTVGVKIDKKEILFGDTEVDLILWDIYGEDEFQQVQTSYLRGAAGYFLVVDGTRPNTLDTALLLKKRTEDSLGKIPVVFCFNKIDLVDEWAIDDGAVASLLETECTIIKTSAKSGTGVEEAFLTLTKKMLATES